MATYPLTRQNVHEIRPEMKTLFFSRSHALGHVAIMHNDQHSTDAEVNKPHRYQQSREFAGFGDLKYEQRRSYCQHAKACEYPGRSGLNSHCSMGACSRLHCVVVGGDQSTYSKCKTRCFVDQQKYLGS